MRTSGQSVQVSNMELHGYNLNGISRHRESFQQLHHKSGRKLGLALIANDDLIASILNRNGLVTGHG